MEEKLNPQFSGNSEMVEPDVQIITSGGLRIPAHSHILVSASPVLESMIERPQKHRSSQRNIPMPGVPCDAVSAFLQFLYSSKCSEEQMEKYGMHLLALSHVYLVPQLKQRCTRGLSGRLTMENVLDVLQLARLCDAPDLYLKCMKFLFCNFKAVEQTEGWKFLQNHDPWLELEILQFIDEAEKRKKRTRRKRVEQNLYLQLSEAMDCLEHICTEGCTGVGPYDMDPSKNKGPCSKFSTCHGLQLLIKHFAACKKRVNGGCLRCKRMWQLLRLHSSICDQPDECRVPLCRQFKLKVQQNRRGDDSRWRLLVKKVVSVKTISSLSLPKRKREEEPRITRMRIYLE
ncbi:BTB/POZ and TAZ domain-containing protein 1 [Forsythia ovata]|uniref:BTB/POZ and TAZ domain-containing protein 1 n=1 Tax=Forsythia ovata TaxID=205694 RepID=A0ABD1P8V5_9LAMI